MFGSASDVAVSKHLWDSTDSMVPEVEHWSEPLVFHPADADILFSTLGRADENVQKFEAGGGGEARQPLSREHCFPVGSTPPF